ncbi:MAG: branched-chain amino acid ABC transporter ATP-binding protein/permease [Actinomycetota bacterium]|nr:branched-chain amino acid ABC transporter ATP-binding protein/permease [Actinomycetota bacterium]
MEYWIDVFNQAMITAILAVSLNVLMGYAGQISVAHMALAGVGGYAAAYLSSTAGTPFILCLVIAMVAAALIGILLSLPALRLGTEHLILLTLAFATVLVTAITGIPGLGGTYGLQGITPPEWAGEMLVRPSQLLWLILIVAAVCFAISWRLGESPFGRVLKGIREDEVATRALGKNVFSFKVLTFGVTAGIAGVGGALIVYYNQLASPVFFGFDVATVLIAAVVIGGTGSFYGAIIGAFLLRSLEPVLEKVVALEPTQASLWQLVIYGVILLVVIRLRPDGLIPEGASISKLFRRNRRKESKAAAAKGGEAAVEAQHSIQATVDPDTGLSADLASGPEPAGSSEVVLKATNLGKSFGGIKAVSSLDISLQKGRITALIGPNGAGKTTVFNLLTGEIPADEGSVTLRGAEIAGLSPDKTTNLGLVRSFQDVRTYGKLSLLENVMIAVPDQAGEKLFHLYLRPLAVKRSEKHSRERAMECLEFVGLGDRSEESAGDLGYGDQKLLAIARLLATGGDVLLIDEPASGIDRSALDPVLTVLRKLRDEGKTICLVEHNLDVVGALADHVVFMEEGRATAEGTMDEIIGQERLSAVYFGHAQGGVR